MNYIFQYFYWFLSEFPCKTRGFYKHPFIFKCTIILSGNQNRPELIVASTDGLFQTLCGYKTYQMTSGVYRTTQQTFQSINVEDMSTPTYCRYRGLKTKNIFRYRNHLHFPRIHVFSFFFYFSKALFQPTFNIVFDNKILPAAAADVT
jgi:hypothetical protein